VSLYRQPGRFAARTLALAASGSLVVGLAVGFGVGRAGAPEPSLADRVAELRRTLAPAEHGIELTATEYGQAVSGGRVVAPTEYDAARGDVSRTEAAVTAARPDLRALDPGRAAALEAAVARMSAAVRTRSDAAEVRRRSDAAARALDAALGR
jgi:hypothetical protein